jgi:hypothetical protein
VQHISISVSPLSSTPAADAVPMKAGVVIMKSELSSLCDDVTGENTLTPPSQLVLCSGIGRHGERAPSVGERAGRNAGLPPRESGSLMERVGLPAPDVNEPERDTGRAGPKAPTALLQDIGRTSSSNPATLGNVGVKHARSPSCGEHTMLPRLRGFFDGSKPFSSMLTVSLVLMDKFAYGCRFVSGTAGEDGRFPNSDPCSQPTGKVHT